MIRLYNKHELALAYNSNNKYYDKVKQQYDYARENVDSIKRVAGLDTTNPDGSQHETYFTIALSKVFDFVKRLIYLAAAFIIFTMIFKNVSHYNLKLTKNF